MLFLFDEEKIKETMSRKESKFYVIKFIDPQIIFLENKILTPRVMQTHIQESCKEDKWKRRECIK